MKHDVVAMVNVLGEMYTVKEVDPADDAKMESRDGYTDTSIKECVIDSMQKSDADSKANLQEYKKSVVRHELIHAFLFESGLDACSWAANEEMVDWIALQFPKMAKAFELAGCL